MKKTIIAIVCGSILLAMVLGCWLFLSSANYLTPMTDALQEQTARAREDLSDTSRYTTRYGIKLTDEIINNNPFLLVHFEWYNYENGALSLEEHREQDTEYMIYLALGEVVYWIEQKENEIYLRQKFSGKPDMMLFSTDSMWYWVEDLRNASMTQYFCGEKCNVLDVVAFIGEVPGPVMVYYVTDRGTFVRGYPSNMHPATWEMRAEDYQNHVASGGEDFMFMYRSGDAEFVERLKTETSLQDASELLRVEDAYRTRRAILIIGGIGVFALCCGLLPELVLRKRKKATPPREEEPPTEL